jgi:hypothetical protein
MTERFTDPTGPDTEGPEATPEQDSFARGLLASLRAEDPAIPDYVAQRLDAVLAEERRDRAPTSGVATALTDPSGTDDPASGSTPIASVTVLPTSTARRPGRSWQVLTGAAAAVVLVIGGGVVISQGGLAGLGGDSASTAGAMAMDDRSAEVLTNSGTAYSQGSLAQQAADLVARAKGVGGADSTPQPLGTGASVTAGGETPEYSSSSTAPPAQRLLSADTLPGCLLQLTGRTDVTPVAVDQATFDGVPADVLVLPSPTSPDKLDVWVVGPGCTAERADLLEFRRIDAP